jgi:hypothetical protein
VKQRLQLLSANSESQLCELPHGQKSMRDAAAESLPRTFR